MQKVSQTVLCWPKKFQKKKKKKEIFTKFTFKDSCFIVCTSNLCGKRFSKSGYILDNRRKVIFSNDFESQQFLHVNLHSLDIEGVHNMLMSHEYPEIVL